MSAVYPVHEIVLMLNIVSRCCESHTLAQKATDAVLAHRREQTGVTALRLEEPCNHSRFTSEWMQQQPWFYVALLTVRGQSNPSARTEIPPYRNCMQTCNRVGQFVIQHSAAMGVIKDTDFQICCEVRKQTWVVETSKGDDCHDAFFRTRT